MHRYALRDDQWVRIKDFLPGREGHVGGTAADNRLFVDAVIYRYRTGMPWRDLRSCPNWWCKSGGHGLSSTLARAVAQAAAMRRGLALGSSLKPSSVSRLM